MLMSYAVAEIPGVSGVVTLNRSSYSILNGVLQYANACINYINDPTFSQILDPPLLRQFEEIHGRTVEYESLIDLKTGGEFPSIALIVYLDLLEQAGSWTTPACSYRSIYSFPCWQTNFYYNTVIRWFILKKTSKIIATYLVLFAGMTSSPNFLLGP